MARLFYALLLAAILFGIQSNAVNLRDRFRQQPSAGPLSLIAPNAVCSAEFKADFETFYVNGPVDTKLVDSKDDEDICKICASTMRLAYLYVNDVRTRPTWFNLLSLTACTNQPQYRKADCQRLVEALTASEQPLFGGTKGLFSKGELNLTPSELSIIIDRKVHDICKSQRVACCSANSKMPITPLDSSPAADLKELDNQKTALASQKAALEEEKKLLEEQKGQVGTMFNTVSKAQTELNQERERMEIEKRSYEEAQAKFVAEVREKRINAWLNGDTGFGMPPPSEDEDE